MVKQKRTYSQRDKKAAEQEARRKRSKSGDDDEIRLSSNRQVESPQKSCSLLKKGLKKHGGPTSIPKNEDDYNTQNSMEHTSVLDKALNGKLVRVTRKRQTIYGSREDFEEAIKEQSLTKKSNGISPNTYLLTPPSELPKKHIQQLNRSFPGLNVTATKVENPVERPITKLIAPSKSTTKKTHQNNEPQPAYVAKQCNVDGISAPRRDLSEDRLPSKSAEAKLWSINQSNSLFLRLPGEIRNRIYDYVLGGNTINIGYKTYHSNHENVVPVFRYHCTVFHGRTVPYKTSQQTQVKIYSDFALLNAICRQLYVETAALPYKLNTIAFESHNIMINFILIEQRLSRQQRHALTHLALPDNLPGANMLTFLPNLEKVFLGFAQSLDKLQGWYDVVREDGKKPKLSKYYPRYKDNIIIG